MSLPRSCESRWAKLPSEGGYDGGSYNRDWSPRSRQRSRGDELANDGGRRVGHPKSESRREGRPKCRGHRKTLERTLDAEAGDETWREEETKRANNWRPGAWVRRHCSGVRGVASFEFRLGGGARDSNRRSHLFHYGCGKFSSVATYSRGLAFEPEATNA